jgi:transcriptional regulator with XRE-family HTH domain
MNTSQRARSFRTLLAQMADLERGQRIRELRLAKHMTQPAAAELAGVTLRAYQAWEAGGGIRFEHVKTLARALNGDADFILNGPKPATPDPFTGGVVGVVLTRIDRVEAKLDRLDQINEKLDLILNRLEAAILPDDLLQHLAVQAAELAVQQPAQGSRESGRGRAPKTNRSGGG